MVKSLNVESFATAIASGISLIDFWASWCLPCRAIAPTIEEIATENTDVTVGKINVDEYPDIASNYDIMSIPTLLLFKDGILKDHVIGVVGKNIIQRKIDALK